jgi:hypothetical protein
MQVASGVKVVLNQQAESGEADEMGPVANHASY